MLTNMIEPDQQDIDWLLATVFSMTVSQIPFQESPLINLISNARCLSAKLIGPTTLQESEYAAWTLVNGYSLNHAAVSVHRLQGLK